MPEIIEIRILLSFIYHFLTWAGTHLPAGALCVEEIWTDIRFSEIAAMSESENQLVQYAQTLTASMLKDKRHREWAVRLLRLAQAVPDTHGLMIKEVWELLPSIYQSQLSPNQEQWEHFTRALYNLDASKKTTPIKLPEPWHRKARPGMDKVKFNRPSQCKLAIQLSRYTPPTWRGRNPDRREDAALPPQRAWDEDSRSYMIGGVSRCIHYLDLLKSQACNLYDGFADLYELIQRNTPNIRALSVTRRIVMIFEKDILHDYALLDTVDTIIALVLCVEERRQCLLASLKKFLPTICDTADLFPDFLATSISQTALTNIRAIYKKLAKSGSLRELAQIWSSLESILGSFIAGLAKTLDELAPANIPACIPKVIAQHVEPGPALRRGRSAATALAAAPASTPAPPTKEAKPKKPKAKPKPRKTKGRKPRKTKAQKDLEKLEENQQSLAQFIPGADKVVSVSSKPISQPRPAPKEQLSLAKFNFTISQSAAAKSVAGVSKKLADMGIPKAKLGKNHVWTEEDIDTSTYLFPSHLFPILNDSMAKMVLTDLQWDPVDAMRETGMEWIGVEGDPRDLVLNLKTCYLEQFNGNSYTVGASAALFSANIHQEGVAGCCKNTKRSKDNNSRAYWLSCEDVKASRPGRVPDILFEHWEWLEYTAKHLQFREAKDDKKAVGSVLGQSGSHPTRGIGRYMRDEVLNLAGIAPGTTWGPIRKDPRKLAAIYTSFRFLMMRQAVDVDKFLKRSLNFNRQRNDGSFLLMTTTNDTVRYARELAVHGKLESVTSSRRRRLIAEYNRMSDRTHIEATPDNFFMRASAKTDMKDAPWFFDPGEVAPAILLFDGLGPTLFGDRWQEVLEEEGEKTVTEEMRQFYLRLPKGLSRIQKLSLKPLTDLTGDEYDELVYARGGTVNPLIRYFESGGTDTALRSISEPESEEEQSSGWDGSDVSSSRISSQSTSTDASTDWEAEFAHMLSSRMPTRPVLSEDSGTLYTWSTSERGGTWRETYEPYQEDNEDNEWANEELCLIKDGHRTRLRTYLYGDREKKKIWTLTRAPFSTVHPDDANQPRNAIVFCRQSEAKRRKSTLEYVQRFEKDLTEKQQRLAFRAKEAHHNPHFGFRKGTKSQVEAQQTLRANARKDLEEGLGHEPDEADVLAKVRADRASKKKAKGKATGGKREMVSNQPFKIHSKRLQEKFQGEEGAALLQTQASRALGKPPHQEKST
ncbi:hypothetical protein B0H17DRAFT_1148312 [Mycena rosella]|uniref:Uncharacterized protein n=1 Tax=Mycena rosella TaxID=1033263 RepID=A0AAD7CDM8_MYCRO|nr:hypothetical protein B0H17DRAFT_1148312 [Mycena rosella]